jgi:hypothetical protein
MTQIPRLGMGLDLPFFNLTSAVISRTAPAGGELAATPGRACDADGTVALAPPAERYSRLAVGTHAIGRRSRWCSAMIDDPLPRISAAIEGSRFEP